MSSFFVQDVLPWLVIFGYSSDTEGSTAFSWYIASTGQEHEAWWVETGSSIKRVV